LILIVGFGLPVIVDDGLWGVLAATTDGRRLPDVAEQRLHQFAGLTAAAVANAQARADLHGLADEQAALLAVADLVARAAPPEAVFAAVTAEASRLLHGDGDDSDPLRRVAQPLRGGDTRRPRTGRCTDHLPTDTLPDRIQRGGTVTRVDDYTHEADVELAAEYNLAAAVAAPITVAGDVWGMLTPPPAWAHFRPAPRTR
jgi:hypothetical protein